MKLLPALLLAMTASATAQEFRSADRLEKTIRSEMREWGIGGIAVALVADGEVVHLAGFGEARPDSIFRAGSISKLFNAIAVMQLVEEGKLHLDAPLPADLLPLNPFPDTPPVTLRQLLCHRSGLQRETAVGSYFDDSQPSLAATVGSLRDSVLVTVPGDKTRYSNVGASLAGHLVAQASGISFEDYQQKHLLDPLGMQDSAWTLARTARERLIVSHMRVADGMGGWTRREAPVFDLGTIPAGNLFATAGDLARFARALLAKDAGGLVKPATLREMWTPQLTEKETGFGIGFAVGRFRDHRSIGHNGAVYGHSCAFSLLPDVGLGAIVLGNEDIANGRIAAITREALTLLLEEKRGEAPPAIPNAIRSAELDEFAGSYESESYWAELSIKGDRLVGSLSGQPIILTPTGELTFTAESRIESASPIVFARGADGTVTSFTRAGQTFRRVPSDPPPLPKGWHRVLGSYGPECIPLVISERHGHLYAMTENMVDYRLIPVNSHLCTICPGMYTDEEVVILTREDGSVHGLQFAGMPLVRRD